MKLKLLTIAAMVIGIGVAGVYTFERWPRASDFEILGTPSLEPQIGGAGKDTPTTVPTTQPVASSRPQIASTASKREQMEKAAASSNPTVQFEAYTLAYDCITRPLLCGDLRPGDVSWDKRKPLVISAALAGVPGAYIALSRYETSGSTLTKDAYWSDPAEYARLVAQAKQAGIAGADMGALSEVLAGSTTAPVGMNNEDALKMWIELLAAKQWDEERTLYNPRADNTPRTKALAATLTIEQQQRALTAALTHIKQTRGIR